VSVQTLVRFATELRAAGVEVTTGRVLTYCRAVETLTPLTRDHLYWAGRIALTSRPEEIPSYDAVFHRFFGLTPVQDLLSSLTSTKPQVEADGPEGPSPHKRGETPDGPPDEPGPPEAEPSLSPALASYEEILRTRRFEELGDEERAAAFALIQRMKVFAPERRSRRLGPAVRGRSIDVRRTIRRSLATQGEPLRRAFKSNRKRHRPLAMLLDVSGSMSPYARALLQFGLAASRSHRRVEVFCFGTRLTRVTRALRASDPDEALAAAATQVQDWEGGTRIGDSLKALLSDYHHVAAIRGAAVIICSDGLETGDPAVLRRQMQRLSRLAHAVVWVNPLKGSPLYEPLARGMAAALPSVDHFVSGHDLRSLEILSELMQGLPRGLRTRARADRAIRGPQE
jgi:uncharacterized protein with von Willebrand factor type A (vWA) domain